MMMELLYIITLSATVILGNYHPNNSLGFLILLILSMFFHLPILTVKLASLINSNRDLLPKIKSTLYALHFLLFIIYFICSLCQVEHISIVHVTAWMILSSWILIMTNLHDLPDTSFHVQMFLNVLEDILKVATGELDRYPYDRKIHVKGGTIPAVSSNPSRARSVLALKKSKIQINQRLPPGEYKSNLAKQRLGE